jgi:hypothetical protein
MGTGYGSKLRETGTANLSEAGTTPRHGKSAPKTSTNSCSEPDYTWYRPAMDHAEERELEQDLKIRLVAPVYFCVSKLEAFAGRGRNDFYASRDLEDPGSLEVFCVRLPTIARGLPHAWMVLR